MAQMIIGSFNIDLFGSTVTSANKYTNFTKNNEIPNFEIMCVVHDLNHCNAFFSSRDINDRFDEMDYKNDNLIIVNFNGILVCFVYVFDYKKMKGQESLQKMLFWYKIKQFGGLKHICIFKPRYAKQDSLTKPYFSFFPYFFGEHDNKIVYHNAMCKSYYHNLAFHRLGFIKIPAQVIYFDAQTKQVSFIDH